MLTQLESYVQRADELAQEVFRIWHDGLNLPPDFKTVKKEAWSYWDSKRSADAYRACEVVSGGLRALREEAEAMEREAKHAFAQARLDFDLLHGLATN